MKKAFLTGLAILTPVVLTVMLITFIIDLFTNPFLGLATTFLKQIRPDYDFLASEELIRVFARIFILAFLCIFLFFLGLIARWFFIRTFLAWGNKLLLKTPIIRSIYNVSRDVISALFSSTTGGPKAFKRPILVPFPCEESKCVGFEAGQVPPPCQAKVQEELIGALIPTAPHPISGYLVMVPKSKVGNLDMTNEEALKLTVSCGVIIPEEERAELANKKNT